MPIESINPATGETLERFDEIDAREVERRVAAARAAFPDWAGRSFADRGRLLHAAAMRLREGKATFARTMTLEMGKPIAQSEAEIDKCAWVCDYYAEHAGQFLARQRRETDARESFVEFEPLGVVLAIMPWNFPFWQVFRFAAPALMAGNTAPLKHASNVPRCALEVEQVFREAGLPEGVFSTLLVGSARTGGVIDDPRIAAVTLTGSDGAGSQVAERAGRALKKTVLELGGSDPFIVLPDADLDRTAAAAAEARLINSGQSCISAKRFIVVEPVADAFLERFVAEMRARRLGDPMRHETQIGPQARHDLRDALHRQVEASVAAGAQLLLGGDVPAGPGAYYPATVLVAREGMAVFEQETFGPVAAVVRARDEDDAVRLANQSVFGLASSIWTGGSAEHLIPRIEAGCVFVNGIAKSDPRLPFGGVKRSGYGRELSEFGIREFVNIKSVWIG